MSDDSTPNVPTDDPLALLGLMIGSGIRWGAAMTTELQHLPETLQQLRRGVDNFEETTRVMAASAARFNDILDLYTRSLGQAAERSSDVARLMQRQVDALSATASPDTAREVLGEVGRAVETLARLNPLWPLSTGSGDGATDPAGDPVIDVEPDTAADDAP